jgi:hypothetical protein
VYDYHKPIRSLLPDPCEDYGGFEHYGLVFNRESHHLSEEALVEALLTLHRSGLIQGRRLAFDDYSVDYGICTLERDEIIARLRHTQGLKTVLYYEFTAAGGAVWETYATPQWERFLSTEGWYYDRWKVWITGADVSLVEHYLEIDRSLGLVQENTVRRKTLQSWQALYWKTLPSALQVSYYVTRKRDLKNRRAILEDSPQRSFPPKWHHDAVTGEWVA